MNFQIFSHKNAQDIIMAEGLILYMSNHPIDNRINYVARKKIGFRFPTYDWIFVFAAHMKDPSSRANYKDVSFYFGGAEVKRAEFLDRLRDEYPDDFEFLIWNKDVLSGFLNSV